MDVDVGRVACEDDAFANVLILPQDALEYGAGDGDTLGLVPGRGQVLRALSDMFDADGAVFGVVLSPRVVDQCRIGHIFSKL